MILKRHQSFEQYLVITGSYWAFTLTDGALRMLILFHFYALGYTPLQIVSLFLLYEVSGTVTNLLGGWMGARWGLNYTLHIGMAIQLLALAMLLVPMQWLTVFWVMVSQAGSGIAKDLNKMSAKSSIKKLIGNKKETTLYRWVALFTESKNTLKGMGVFFCYLGYRLWNRPRPIF